MILESHQTYIYLCGKLKMTSPRDAFITSLCKVCLPPKYAMSLITQRGPTKTQATASSGSSSATQGGSPGTLKVSERDGGVVGWRRGEVEGEEGEREGRVIKGKGSEGGTVDTCTLYICTCTCIE